ncbi:3118_t:CDS:2 [Acaulospora morrowiae]|uniref:3118_t:CDS:1 n=1 Tax=Acaulospora morrowiae TaxID=94023 RepID=A0A9N9FW99_9GLOM|nr:3118_t:CDS:2 [Acaulospora morrowiae]
MFLRPLSKLTYGISYQSNAKFSVSRLLIEFRMPDSCVRSRTFHRSACMMVEQSRGGEKFKGEERRQRNVILPVTPVSELKDRPFPKTAACLVIGDEILNGKTVDINSGFFVKYCFNLGIDVKGIEVIPDEEEIIIEAVRRLSSKHDFVVTSGGIGTTHDDITYPSIARAYDLPLRYHQPTLDRMRSMTKGSQLMQYESHKRMALFPDRSLVIFPSETFWVPIVIVNENVHILPGIPPLFRALLSGYGRYLQGRERFVAKYVKTYRIEPQIAPMLASVQKKVESLGIKIGSYPKWKGRMVVVSLLSKENKREIMEELAREVAEKDNLRHLSLSRNRSF